MLWQDLTSLQHKEIPQNTAVILPVASIEQHGPALPVCVDNLIGWQLCLELNRCYREQVLILPQIKIGYSQHHMDFPGSLTVSHEALILYICDIVESVVAQGYYNILIFNSHGGNQALMQLCVEKLGNKHKHLNIMGTSWWKLCVAELEALKESGFIGNGHAAEFEFSLMEYLQQDLVNYADRSSGATPQIPLPEARGDLLQGSPVNLLRSFKEMTEDGTYGLTANASRAKGEKIFKVAMAGLKSLLHNINQLERR